MSHGPAHDRFSSRWLNLASARIGARPVFVTDDFFAPCARMLSPSPPVFVPGKFDDHGKWMDGWESRRKRVPGHDRAIVRLGVSGVLRGVDIDTRHFVGNHPPHASLDAIFHPDGDPGDDAGWREVLARTALHSDRSHRHDLDEAEPVTHVRLHIYPDGGVARLRVYGEPRGDFRDVEAGAQIDLAALGRGGHAVACSGQGFGSSMHNLTLPGRGRDMGDGWETPRRRGPGHDWVVLALGHVGIVRAIELDTAHYKGNFPDRASVQAARIREPSELDHSAGWPVILAEQKLRMDDLARFDDVLREVGPVSHVRVNIHPDGGLSRVRVYGELHTDAGP